jgi:hypothetical protein
MLSTVGESNLTGNRAVFGMYAPILPNLAKTVLGKTDNNQINYDFILNRP